ncbi:hypothetical protein [Halobellus limi]|uniref:Uncharacterized protein n=1 Tax=Halobellus limi TaxID=699433 RepID=A0A1H5ZVA3_9EURY|nr:hypothetical protein [Halobellus limi]SEG39715.1 hypothetical protein SAMN04488133_2180 [Halobellus limi]
MHSREGEATDGIGPTTYGSWGLDSRIRGFSVIDPGPITGV